MVVVGQHRTTYWTSSHEMKKPFSSEELSPESRFEIVINSGAPWIFPNLKQTNFHPWRCVHFGQFNFDGWVNDTFFFWCYSHLFSTSWILLIFPAAGYIPHFVWVKLPFWTAKGPPAMAWIWKSQSSRALESLPLGCP